MDERQVDTEKYIKDHISRVRKRLNVFVQLLIRRAANHDKSKLEEPELSWWKEMDKEPRYAYGTPEYEDKMKRWKKLFDHHYKHNRHHPEHFKFGISDMTLVDLIELIVDWIGYKDIVTVADAIKVCEQQMIRYKFPEELRSIFTNTLIRYFSIMQTTEDVKDQVPDGITEELHIDKDALTVNDPKAKSKIIPEGTFINTYA